MNKLKSRRHQPPPPTVARYLWRKVEAPQTWRPNPGDNLIGYYGGHTVSQGPHGQYDVAVVHDFDLQSWLVSGTALIRLLDAGRCQEGDVIKIVFRGLGRTSAGYNVKLFDLFVDDVLSDQLRNPK